MLDKHAFLLVTVIVLACVAGCSARLNYSTVHCLQGPDFWCLNETTELLCNFSNKTIGLCGYTNKRCQIKTGERQSSQQDALNLACAL